MYPCSSSLDIYISISISISIISFSRLAIYREFLSSEQSYIKDLTILQEVFHTPFLISLENRSSPCYLKEEEVELVFCNFQAIHKVSL